MTRVVRRRRTQSGASTLPSPVPSNFLGNVLPDQHEIAGLLALLEPRPVACEPTRLRPNQRQAATTICVALGRVIGLLQCAIVLIGCSGLPAPSSGEVALDANCAAPDAKDVKDEAAGVPHSCSAWECEMWGACVPDGKSACIATAATCVISHICKELGYCDLRDSTCDATGTTVAECEKKKPCARAGRCGPKAAGNCRAIDDGHCRASSGCSEAGRCFFDGDSDCIVKANGDCAASTGCKQSGACHLVGSPPDSGCYPVSPQDCAGSARCLTSGECEYGIDPGLGAAICQTPVVFDCATTSGCLVNGYCNWQARRCRVKSDLNCVQSTDCKQ